MKKFCKRAYLALILIFLYLPIVVLIVQSFNAGKSRAKWRASPSAGTRSCFRTRAS